MQNISCNLCGSDSPRVLFETKDLLYKTTNETFHLVRCVHCGLVYLNPRPEEKDLGSFYPEAYRPHEHKKLSGSYIFPQSSSYSLIDIGCGSGEFLSETALKHPDWALYGVDFDQRAVEAATSQGFQVMKGSLEDARYSESFFNEARMEHVLEHVPHPLQTLQEIHRILKPRGKLTILIPNFNSFSRYLFGTYWYHIESPRHLYHFTPKTIEKMLLKAGFENIQVTFIPSAKYFLQSFALFQSSQRKKYPSFIWKALKPPALLVSFFHLSSTMRVTATKHQSVE